MNPGNYLVKQVIVVRNDLNMRKGKIAAQVAHASLNAILRTKQFDEENRYMMKLSLTYDEVYWIMTDYAKVVLQCDSLRDIETIERLCNEAMIPYSVVTDNGTTEFHGVKTVTCIAVGPYRSDEINKITGGYKLL